jgi:uncharacterized protein YuzE
LVTLVYRTRYDASTDSLYIELRPVKAVRSKEIAEDIVCDFGADGLPVGYDVQHASRHDKFITTAIRTPVERAIAAE